jgi:putative acetyltransferase
MRIYYRNFLIRDWQPGDRDAAFHLVSSVLTEYGLQPEPQGCDRDLCEVEQSYWQTGGEFWVVEQHSNLVGTAGYYPAQRGVAAVELRKMYLLPAIRGQGLGRFLLYQLEAAIASRGFQQIWIETSSKLVEAIGLYESSGYQPSSGTETKRCDRVYLKELQVHLKRA